MAIGNMKEASLNVPDDFKPIRELQEHLAKLIIKKGLVKPIGWTK